jgi:hypothetical protein
MIPEDAIFTRDYAPVMNELNRLASILTVENIAAVLKRKMFWEPNEADDLLAELIKEAGSNVTI